MPLPRALPILLLAYGGASLLHFAHNAEFLADYPNMPAWLSRVHVYGAWLALTAVGVLGYFLVCRGHRLAGFFVIAVYAVLGFDGLGHYTRAPMSAHTAAMNATIWLEVLAASLLLIEAIRMSLKRLPS
jgi:hypothetical protein